MNGIITSIFPTPIYLTKLDRNLTVKELNFIKKHRLNVYSNKGNSTSKDSHILEHKIFSNIKEQLLKHINNYFNKIICSKNKINPYITQSWLNYTKENEFHHQHHHSNSIVSGVLYIDADKKHDKIKFYKNKYQQIELEPKEYNLYNSETWWFAIESKDIILFPSYLTHSVEIKKGNNTRISLAFNVFLSGEIGNVKALTKLIL